MQLPVSQIQAILAAVKPKQVAVFGSWVRNQAQETSDIDLLIEYGRTPDLFEYQDLVDALEASLGRRVDLVDVKALPSWMRSQVEQEKVVLY